MPVAQRTRRHVFKSLICLICKREELRFPTSQCMRQWGVAPPPRPWPAHPPLRPAHGGMAPSRYPHRYDTAWDVQNSRSIPCSTHTASPQNSLLSFVQGLNCKHTRSTPTRLGSTSEIGLEEGKEKPGLRIMLRLRHE